MRFIYSVLCILLMSTAVFSQAFDEEETVPERKDPPKPVIQEKKAEPVKPIEAPKPAEPAKPVEQPKVVEPPKPSETVKPAETIKPNEPSKPVEPVKPENSAKPVDEVKPQEPVKPAVVPAEPAKTAEPSVEVIPETERIKLTRTVCAVTGSSIDVNENTQFSDYNGVRFYFVDAARKKEFDKNQWKYVKDIMTCQVCGKQDKKRGRGTVTFPDSRYEGKTYYFCSNAHKSEFDADPMKYIDPEKMYISTKNKKKPLVKQPEKPKPAPEKSLKQMNESTPEGK